MDGLPSLKKEWALTPEAFDTLLACLDRDRDRAAEKYEEIRNALITFFEHRGCLSPEEYADETINRVARRISEAKGKRFIRTTPPVISTEWLVTS